MISMQQRKECLIIDDDPDDQEIFLMCVEKISQDIHCTGISDPVQAVLMLTSNPDYTPQYIFVDVNMPKMSGIECLGILRNMDRLAHTSIYMYSTSSGGKVMEESKNLGATGFIVKPTKVAELREKLSLIFGITPDTKHHGQ